MGLISAKSVGLVAVVFFLWGRLNNRCMLSKRWAIPNPFLEHVGIFCTVLRQQHLESLSFSGLDQAC